MPGATTARLVVCDFEMPMKLFMMPQTVPNGPTKGAVAPMVATPGVVSDDQPDAREGQAGRLGVAERFVVPLKLGNSGGGKGPQFKTDAIRGEGPGRLGNL